MSRAPDKSSVPEGIVPGEPTWDIAQLFPAQGTWSESEYLSLDTNRRVEFSHGFVEFLPMPTLLHQRIVLFLLNALQTFVNERHLGEVLFAGVRVRVFGGKYREPDIVFMLTEHASRGTDHYWEGADLVMEVVSPDDPVRDLVTKREEYAQTGIPEYWIIDPRPRTITVLTLDGTSYAVHGEFKRGEQATSLLLPGFAVDVSAALAPKR